MIFVVQLTLEDQFLLSIVEQEGLAQNSFSKIIKKA